VKPRSPASPVPRVALSREEAARALGVSLDSFERYVQPHVRIIRLGRMRLVSVAELEEWARSAGERAAQPAPGQRVRSIEHRKGGRAAR
jgi:excisionase family DNA binding protein